MRKPNYDFERAQRTKLKEEKSKEKAQRREAAKPADDGAVAATDPAAPAQKEPG